VCSGVFERGMVVTHGSTGRPFATKYAQSVFGRDRSSVEVAYPGDIVGLVNASSLRVGDTIHTGPAVSFPPIESFAPEHFASATVVDSARWKQFRKGVEELDQEGVVQVLRSEARGEHAPVLAAVGPMQFEVAAARLESEFRAAVRLEPLGYSLARRIDPAQRDEVAQLLGVEVMQRRDGTLLALFPDKWRLQAMERRHPDLLFAPLVAGAA
jgi:peptide chain release factor 3